MADADSSIEINIRTTADTSGAKVAETELAKVGATAKATGGELASLNAQQAQHQ